MIDYSLLIKNILVENCSVEAGLINDQADLQSDLGLDSMGLLTLITELENTVNKPFQFSLENAPRTVGEIRRFLEENV